MKRFLVAVAACSALGAWGQNEPVFTSVCVTSKASGFQWRKGEWAHARFSPESKYIAQKIDPDMYRDKPMTEQPIFCESMRSGFVKGGPLLNEPYRQACYVIRVSGREAMLMNDAQVCYERYTPNNVLREVSCKKFKFSPNGLFVSMPSDASMDVDKNPANDYKDSLSIDVGECTKIN